MIQGTVYIGLKGKTSESKPQKENLRQRIIADETNLECSPLFGDSRTKTMVTTSFHIT